MSHNWDFLAIYKHLQRSNLIFMISTLVTFPVKEQNTKKFIQNDWKQLKKIYDVSCVVAECKQNAIVNPFPIKKMILDLDIRHINCNFHMTKFFLAIAQIPLTAYSFLSTSSLYCKIYITIVRFIILLKLLFWNYIKSILISQTVNQLYFEFATLTDNRQLTLPLIMV